MTSPLFWRGHRPARDQARTGYAPAVMITLTLVLGGRQVRAAVSVETGVVDGQPGGEAIVAVALTTDGGELVAGVENEIIFEPAHTPVQITDQGRPDCWANPDIGKESTLFGWRPIGCDPLQGGCTGIQAVVLSVYQALPIPSGSVLYMCRFRVADGTATGIYSLLLRNVRYATPAGSELPATATDGGINVSSTMTDTATVTPSPTATPTVGPSSTATPATPLPTPTTTALAGDADCDGMLTARDLSATAAAIFGLPICNPDCNHDGRVSAADMPCLAQRFAAARPRFSRR